MNEKAKAILLQSRDLFFKYGIKSLTMDDIAQHLGISKKTLYQFYSNKADLINKVLEITISEHKEFFKECKINSNHPIEEMKMILNNVTEMYKTMIPSLEWELKKYYPECYETLTEFKHHYIYEAVLHNITSGVEMGLYRKEINPAVIAKMHTLRVSDIMDRDLFPTDKFNPADLVKELVMYHLYGITTLEGRKEIQSVFELL